MRPGVLFGVAAAVAAVPVLALLALLAAGALAPGPGAAALLAVVLAALGLGGLLARDLGLLAAALRRAVQGAPQPVPDAPSPVLPAIDRIATATEHLARALAARAEEVGRLARTGEAVVEALPDPLLVLGEDGRPRRANAAARAAFGNELAALLRHPDLRAAIARAFETGSPQTAALSLPVPVPRELNACVALLERTLPDGGRAIVLLSDRTHERAVERMRADFVANASHELRTPLAGLVGFIDTLRGAAADDPEAQKQFLAIMAEQAARMNRLIDDLLSLSRIELAEHQPPEDHVDLVELARSVIAGFGPVLAQRHAELAFAAEEGLPPVLADADQIAQVVQNLIDNALKYGNGRIELSLAAASGGRFPPRPGVVIGVHDNGPGIPRAHVPRLTERFYRVDAGRSRRAGGTGLGLSIVRHIVNRHRGALVIDGGAAEDPPGQKGTGATFSVWLPAAREMQGSPLVSARGQA